MSITVLTSPSTYRRDTRAVCDSSGRLWVHGESYTSGGAQDSSNAHAERYDPSTLSWTTLPNSPRYQYGYSFMQDSLNRVVIASGLGCALGGVPAGTNTGAIFDPATDTWASIASMPGITNRTSAVYWNSADHLWVADGGSSLVDTLWYSGGPSGTWTSQASTMPVTLGGSGIQYPGGEPFDAGGLVYVPNSMKYNLATDTWTTLTTLFAALGISSSPRQCCMMPDQRYIYHFLSNLGTPGITTPYRYDTVTDTWVARTALSTIGIKSGAAVIPNGQYIYLIGGQNSGNVFQTSIFQYDTVGDSWSNTGDTLSVARGLGFGGSLGFVAKDTIGPGYYLVQGVNGPGVGTNVVEYWTRPNFVGPTVAKNSWVAVIG